MDNHVIQHFRRCFHQQAVKVKIALCTAASPACTLVSYGDPAIGHADNRGIKLYPFGITRSASSASTCNSRDLKCGFRACSFNFVFVPFPGDGHTASLIFHRQIYGSASLPSSKVPLPEPINRTDFQCNSFLLLRIIRICAFSISFPFPTIYVKQMFCAMSSLYHHFIGMQRDKPGSSECGKR